MKGRTERKLIFTKVLLLIVKNSKWGMLFLWDGYGSMEKYRIINVC